MQASKEKILNEIRRLAGVRGGHIGLRAFLEATGIPEKQIVGVHWPRWNDALVEAGVQTRKFERDALPDEQILESIASLVARLGRWPTENELRMAKRASNAVPNVRVIKKYRSAADFRAKMVAFCAARPEFLNVPSIIDSTLAIDEETVDDFENARVKGHVYMMRSGRRFKIGFTNSPTRRHREVRVELPDPTTLIHSIETDDPAGIEAYWHRRFQAKRVRDTEFFELEAADVAAFKRRKYQ